MQPEITQKNKEICIRYIGGDTVEYLSRYFKHVRFPNANVDLCGEDEFYTAFKAHIDRKVKEWYEEKVGHELPEFKRNKGCEL